MPQSSPNLSVPRCILANLGHRPTLISPYFVVLLRPGSTVSVTPRAPSPEALTRCRTYLVGIEVVERTEVFRSAVDISSDIQRTRRELRTQWRTRRPSALPSSTSKENDLKRKRSQRKCVCSYMRVCVCVSLRECMRAFVNWRLHGCRRAFERVFVCICILYVCVCVCACVRARLWIRVIICALACLWRKHGRRLRGTGGRPPNWRWGTAHISVPPIFRVVVLSEACESGNWVKKRCHHEIFVK